MKVQKESWQVQKAKRKIKFKRRSGEKISGLDKNPEVEKMKALKITVFFAGHRREWSEESGPKAELSLLKYTIEQETKIDYGMPTDLLLVNHYPSERDLELDKKFEDKEGYKSYINYFNSLNGTRTKNGKIITHDQENKIGMSTLGLEYGYKTYKNDYDFWYFCEDDIITVKNNVMRTGATMLIQKPDVFFVSTLGWWKCNTTKKRVARGTVGITSTANIENFFMNDGRLMTSSVTTEKTYWDDELHAHAQCERWVSVAPQLSHGKKIELIPIGGSVVKWKHEGRKLDSGPSRVAAWNQGMERF